MAQNFRRRITLIPNPLYNSQNSMKKFKEIDLLEKADNDTFNKSTINKITPIKEKSFDPSLLETPFIEKDKKKRRISIYSPLSFNIYSNLKSTSIFSEIKDNNNYIENSSNKKITNFSPGLFPEIDEIFTNFEISRKIKRIGIKQKIENDVTFVDEKNKKYIFTLYNDKNIFGEDNNIINDDMKYLNTHEDENSDEEQIENDHLLSIKQLNEGIDYYSKFPNCISRHTNYNK